MISSFTIAVLACFVMGAGIAVALAVRGTNGSRAGGSIARVLYEAEHPENRR